MKKSLLFLSLTLSIFACKKDAIIDPTAISPSEKRTGKDYSDLENLFTEAYNMVDYEAQKETALNEFLAGVSSDRSICPSIQITPQGNVFPKTMVLDYGTGCTTPQGNAVSGTITAVYSGKNGQAGTSVAITFQNVVYKGYTLNGNYQVTYTSGSGFTVSITNASALTPDGETITYAANLTMLQTSGAGTNYFTHGEAGILDNVYSVSGNGSGTDSEGNNYTFAITTALVRSMDCEWISKGVAELKISGQATKSLDFGDGTCDNAATLTIGRLSTPVTLP